MATETTADRVADLLPKPSRPEDETAHDRIAVMLAEKARLDIQEAKYKQLVTKYGGNRKARRRARAEVRRASK